MQDRIKEWGKRYLQPIAEWFGIEFPDRVQKVGESHIRLNTHIIWDPARWDTSRCGRGATQVV